MIVTCCDENSKIQNYKKAYRELQRRLSDTYKNQDHLKINEVRKKQIGLGMRGDKIRTYRVRDNLAKDHRTGKKISLDKLNRGEWF